MPAEARRLDRSPVSARSILFALAIFMATGAAVIVVSLARAIWRSVARGEPIDRLPWGLVVAIVVLPVVTFAIAAIGTRRAAGGTFFAQAAANRRNSILLVITLVGIVAATAEIIAVTLTFEPVPALWSAAVAAVIGLGAAAAANRFGGERHPRDRRRATGRPEAATRVLLDVVAELAIAANIPPPRRLRHRGQEPERLRHRPRPAARIGRGHPRPARDGWTASSSRASSATNSAHIRNLDTRYALYVAVLVGLVALATDGFLRLVIEGWRNGAFTSGGDGDDALAGLVMGVLIGVFLLIVAGLLRLVAPLFSALVQASTSRAARVPRRRDLGRVHAQPPRPRTGARVDRRG